HPLEARLNRDAAADAAAIAATGQPSAAPAGTALRARAGRVASPKARRSGIGPGFVVLTVALAAGVLGGAYALAVRDGLDLRSTLRFQDSPGAAAARSARESTLPLPRRSELALERARSLAANGRIHEALAVLDGIRATDSQKGEADRLRADLQRQLLGL